MGIWIEIAVDGRTNGGMGRFVGCEPTLYPKAPKLTRANGTRMDSVGKMGKVSSPR